MITYAMNAEIFVELNLRKNKWLLFGSYHLPSQSDEYFFSHVKNGLDIYREVRTVSFAISFRYERHLFLKRKIKLLFKITDQ